MIGFRRAVREAQNWFSASLAEAPLELREAFSKGPTEEEADSEALTDCVARFARAELEGTPLGRYGPVKVFPPLGEHQAKQLRDADASRQDEVKNAIGFAVALGYTFMAAIEADGHPNNTRDARAIWNVWIPNLNTGMIEQTVMPPDMLSDLRRSAAGAFRERALRLDLGGLGKKGRLGRSGAYYGQAGALLRAIHVHPGQLKPDPANLWPFENHPA